MPEIIRIIANMVNVIMQRREITAVFRKTEQGKPLVTLSGFPSADEGLTPNALRELAETLYQIARDAERDYHNFQYFWGN